MDDPIYRLPDLIIHPTPLESEIQATPWHVVKSRIADARQKFSVDGSGVLVAIGDTGFDRVHCESGGLQGRVSAQYDFTGEGHFDEHGHGSHVAGCVLSIAPKCSLINVKCLSQQGGGGDFGIAQSIRRAADEGAAVYNGSYGSSMPSQLILGALEYSVGKGCIPFIAAGNTGKPRDVQWPARSPACISVSAVDESDRIAAFSSTGPEVDLGWYGVKILSFGRNGGFAVMSGTSMSAPLATGLYALLVESEVKAGGRKTKTLETVMQWLVNCCSDAGAPGRDEQFGIGIPDAMKAFGTPTPVRPVREYKLGPITIHEPPLATDRISLNY